MAEVKNKKVTASEVASDLRKMKRMYEVFEHAAEAAAILAGFENTERELKNSIEKLKKEFATWDNKCDEAADEAADKEKKLKSIEAKVRKAKVVQEQLVQEATQKAEAKAAQIVGAAEVELQGLKKSISQLREDKKDITQDIVHARQDLFEAQARIQEVKDKAIKALT